MSCHTKGNVRQLLLNPAGCKIAYSPQTWEKRKRTIKQERWGGRMQKKLQFHKKIFFFNYTKKKWKSRPLTFCWLQRAQPQSSSALPSQKLVLANHGNQPQHDWRINQNTCTGQGLSLIDLLHLPQGHAGGSPGIVKSEMEGKERGKKIIQQLTYAHKLNMYV